MLTHRAFNCNDNEILIFAQDEVTEWLRRWTANPLGSARVGSNPILVDDFEACHMDGYMYSDAGFDFKAINTRIHLEYKLIIWCK